MLEVLKHKVKIGLGTGKQPPSGAEMMSSVLIELICGYRVTSLIGFIRDGCLNNKHQPNGEPNEVITP